LTDNGSEFSHAKFTQYLQSIHIKHKRQPTGTPAKHIENLNLNIRRAATKFRTTYDTKRIKDFVPVYCKRYNNTVHNRTRASPNKVVKMSPEELDGIKKVSIQIASKRNETRGRRLRKIGKGDKVRIVDEKHRKRREKVKVGQTHTPPGLRWGKTVYVVLKIKKGSVQIKRGLEPEWIQRPYVQLISEESDQRKEYTDRPQLDDEFDPEKAERGTPAQRAAEKAKPKDAETERLLAKAKLRKVDQAKEKLAKKDVQKKKRAVQKARRNINRPAPQNQHPMSKFLKKKPAPKKKDNVKQKVDLDMTLESESSSDEPPKPAPKPAPKRAARKPAPKRAARKPRKPRKPRKKKPDKKQQSLTKFFKNLT
jgi:hypothetical protein